MRLTGAGNCIWAKAFGGEAIPALAAELDDAGNIVVVGQVLEEGTPVDVGCVPAPAPAPASVGGFVTKQKGSDGSCLWARTFAGWGEAVAIDASSSVYAGGALFGKMPFAGTTLTPVSMHRDALLLKYDGAGNELWGQNWSSAAPDSYGQVDGVTVTPDQRVWISGSYSGNITFEAQTFGPAGNNAAFVFGLTPSGAPVATATFTTGETGNLLEGPQITVDRTGMLVATGQFASNITIGSDTLTVPKGASFLAKLDPSSALSPLWSRAFDGSAVNGFDIDHCDDILVTGSFDGTPDLGCGQTGPNTSDGFFWGTLGP